MTTIATPYDRDDYRLLLLYKAAKEGESPIYVLPERSPERSPEQRSDTTAGLSANLDAEFRSNAGVSRFSKPPSRLEYTGTIELVYTEGIENGVHVESVQTTGTWKLSSDNTERGRFYLHGTWRPSKIPGAGSVTLCGRFTNNNSKREDEGSLKILIGPKDDKGTRELRGQKPSDGIEGRIENEATITFSQPNVYIIS